MHVCIFSIVGGLYLENVCMRACVVRVCRRILLPSCDRSKSKDRGRQPSCAHCLRVLQRAFDSTCIQAKRRHMVLIESDAYAEIGGVFFCTKGHDPSTIIMLGAGTSRQFTILPSGLGFLSL